MGRFTKLETGDGAQPEKDAEAGPFGLRARVRPKEITPATGMDYDLGHYQQQGDASFFSGDYKKALRHYSRAMEVDNSAVEPWIGQILSLLMMGQSREAVTWAMRATELFPEEPRLASLQGLALASTGARQRAIACSDFAMGCPGPHAQGAFVWAIRGQILSRADNPNAAFCLDKAREVRQPGDWKVMALIGGFLMGEKKWARALEFLKPAVEANPGNAWLWKLVGIANENLAFTQRAMEAYMAALDIDPNDREAQSLLVRLSQVPLPVRLWRRLFGRKKSS